MARQINPVLAGVDRTEVLSDPALRELYFGSTDTPGLIAQATQAAQKAYLDQPAILQETAGLTPDELQARQIARAGIGSFQPFLSRAEQAYGTGLGALQSSIGFGGPSARQLLGLSLQQYDPRMARTFYDPFEEQVVQQTIQDTLKAAAQQDIQQRAADIARGGESAFGSRARLTAGERQAAIGRGLGEVLGKIRSGGFQTSQQRALEELQRQREAAGRAAQLEAGFGGDIAAAQRLFGSDIAGLGAEQQRLRGIDIGQLEGLGGVERGIEEQRLARQYAQQVEQRQAPLFATQFVQGFAPQYVAGQTRIDKQYGMPVDPASQGLGAFLSAYTALKPPMQYQPPATSQGPAQTNQPPSAYDANTAREGISQNTGTTSFYSPTFGDPSRFPAQTYNPGTLGGQQQILAGGQFAGPSFYGPVNPTQPINTQQAFQSGSAIGTSSGVFNPNMGMFGQLGPTP